MSWESRHLYESIDKDKSKIYLLSSHLTKECSLLSSFPSGECVQGLHVGKERNITSAKLLSLISCFNVLGSAKKGSYFRSNSIKIKVSNCKRFVLVARLNVIHVYKLDGTKIRQWTKVIYPQRVSTMCMDTSPEYYALGALLLKGPAVVCDINPEMVSLERTMSVVRDPLYWQSMFRRRYANEIGKTEDASNLCRKSRASFNGIDLYTGLGEYLFVNDTNDVRTFAESYINQTWNIHSLTVLNPGTDCGVARASSSPEGPHTIFPNDGSMLTVPESMAICAKRRCVAFGTYNGVELHWTDQVTGEDMNRWFATNGRHELLHFVPANCGNMLPERIQMVTSLSYPIDDIIGSDHMFARETPSSENLLSVNRKRMMNEPSISYAALPLDDGYHIIYLDCINGSLCLGCRTISRGQMRVRAKVVFRGPSENSRVGCYRFLTRKEGGIILVAGFRVASQDRIYMYSIPPEIVATPFDLQRPNSKMIVEDALKVASTLNTHLAWTDWWPSEDNNFKRNQDGNSISWPIVMRGTYFAESTDVADVAIQFDSHLIIWIFRQNGDAAVYSTYNEKDTDRAIANHAQTNNNNLPVGSLNVQIDTATYRNDDRDMAHRYMYSSDMEDEIPDSGYGSV